MDPDRPAPQPVEPDRGYQPPRIEFRLGAEALEREILYAGPGSVNQT
jgi:hypothetical protein